MTIASLYEFIGRFHPLFVHLPIGILVIGLVFQWLSKLKKYRRLRIAVPFLMFFGALAAAFSCLTGYLLSLSGEYDGSTLDWHMWMGIGVFVLAVVLCTRLTRSKTDHWYTALGVGLFLLISATGHLGGTLTHGDNYLMNPFVSSEPEQEIKKIIPNVQQAVVYADIVQPILQNKCYNCHGPHKQKGKYRMDSPEALMKGGKQGSAIVLGNAEESEIIRRLRLPKQDKHHMAPSSKTQMTENEVVLLHWWIETGADIDRLVSQTEQPEEIKPLLLALQSDQQEMKALPIIPVDPVNPAHDQDIQKLKDAGVVVMPVARNSNYLMANFVMAPEAGDQQAALLAGIKDQLVWLKVGDTNITDAALSVISTCTNLIQLQLNNTEVSDKGIALLKDLQHLQSISLVGTKVTANGVKSLSKMGNLQSIYLYRSAVDKGEMEALVQLFATTTLDTGGYAVPTLMSDTTLVK